ncbi:Ms4527A family Cys-rich leader peptide [Mycobacterium sp. HNNTM2301]|uniref:Ms4527A family Cys-rich leader peptide n=1 Tax=Mycobacterium hainanense TaxID=3289775 RepID=UPI0035A73EF0
MPNDPTVRGTRPRGRFGSPRPAARGGFLGFLTRATSLIGNSAHREPIFDLVTWPPGGHGTMGNVTVAQPSLRIALVARRHIDLKRVCSCCCLP